MNTSALRSTVAALFLGLAGLANAATVVPVETATVVGGDGTFTVTDSDTGNSATFDISPVPVTVFYIDSNITNDPSVIAQQVELAFGLSPGTLGGLCDGCGSVSGSTLNISDPNGFDFLAVHLGGAELFFHWASSITSATLTLLANDPPPGLGFSNWRTFSAIPVPGAAILFLSALGFLGFGRKLAGREQPAEPLPA